MNKDQLNRLNELEAFLADARAYLTHCAKTNEPCQGQLLTLVHDICGLHNQESCFVPRVDGWRNRDKAVAHIN